MRFQVIAARKEGRKEVMIISTSPASFETPKALSKS